MNPHYLIQILLPLYDADRQPFPRRYLDDMKKVLTEKFGGVTIYRNSPAEGLWKNQEKNDAVDYDTVIIVEVMTEELDENWWKDYRTTVEHKFQQEHLVVRVLRLQLI